MQLRPGSLNSFSFAGSSTYVRPKDLDYLIRPFVQTPMAITRTCYLPLTVNDMVDQSRILGPSYQCSLKDDAMTSGLVDGRLWLFLRFICTSNTLGIFK